MKSSISVVFLFSFFFVSVFFAGSAHALVPGAQPATKEEWEAAREEVVGVRGAGCVMLPIESPDIRFDDDVYKCINEKEECRDGSIVFYSCCVCEWEVTLRGKTTKVRKRISESRATYTSCQEECKKQGPNGVIVTTLGAGTYGAPKTSGEPTAAELKQKLALCFTPAECAKPEYGKSAEAFRSGQGCPSGQGRCVAPEPELTLSFPIGGVKTVQGLRNFIALAFKYLMSIAATAAGVMFVYGGFRYIVGSAAENVSRAKEIMVDAAVGLLLTLGAFTILQTVNPATLQLNRLEVFMINQQRLLASNSCGDLQVGGGEKLLFAEAGQAPDYIDTNKASFDIEQNETKCGAEYYVQGFEAGRCFGFKCLEGGACVSCRGGGCKAGAAAAAYECQEFNFSGTINFSGGAYAIKLGFYAVCKNVKDVNTGKTVVLDNGIEEIGDANLTEGSGDSGSQGYTISFDAKEIDDAVEECKDKGGLVGFVLATQYHDAALAGIGYDEVVAIGRKNCGGGKFSGYIDGSTTLTGGKALMNESALFCGLLLNSFADAANYWSLNEVQAAAGIDGAAKPLQCNFSLSSVSNAPPDPASKAKNISAGFKSGDADVKCGIP